MEIAHSIDMILFDLKLENRLADGRRRCGNKFQNFSFKFIRPALFMSAQSSRYSVHQQATERQKQNLNSTIHHWLTDIALGRALFVCQKFKNCHYLRRVKPTVYPEVRSKKAFMLSMADASSSLCSLEFFMLAVES